MNPCQGGGDGPLKTSLEVDWRRRGSEKIGVGSDGTERRGDDSYGKRVLVF